jgi:hypothetical protein
MSYQTESLTASELTQKTMLSDLKQQPMLWAGAALAVVALVLFWTRREPSQASAARHLVRDWRGVDDVDDARDLLGSNMPIILRPAMLAGLEALEDQVHTWFRQAERFISKM